MANGITISKVYNELQNINKHNSLMCTKHEDMIRANELQINTNSIDIKNLTNIVGNISRNVNKIMWAVIITIGGAIVITVLGFIVDYMRHVIK